MNCEVCNTRCKEVKTGVVFWCPECGSLIDCGSTERFTSPAMLAKAACAILRPRDRKD